MEKAQILLAGETAILGPILISDCLAKDIKQLFVMIYLEVIKV